MIAHPCLAPLADALAARGLPWFDVWPRTDGTWSARFETAAPG